MAKLLFIADQMHTIAYNIVKDAKGPVNIQEVATHPLATKIGCQTHHAASALQTLVRTGKLSRYKAGRMWMFELPPAKGEPVIKPVEVPVEVKQVVADLKVQVDREHKTLRLEFEKIRIEISIV